MTYTKGEWKHISEQDGDNINSNKDYIKSGNYYIAELFVVKETLKANARLIASAPELLAACKAFVKARTNQELRQHAG